MKNLKSLGLVAVVLVASVVGALAAPPKVNVPRDQNNNTLSQSDYAGYSHMRNSGTSEMIVCSGRCLLKGLIMSTGPVSSYLQVRNTSVAQGNGALVLGRYVRFTPVNSGPRADALSAPILLDKGISLTLSSVSADEDVTVLFLDLDD